MNQIKFFRAICSPQKRGNWRGNGEIVALILIQYTLNEHTKLSTALYLAKKFSSVSCFAYWFMFWLEYNKSLKSELLKHMNKSIQEALKALQSGKTILYPTDTIWGIGCDATNAEAIEKIYSIKKRDHSKSMLILCADEEMLRRYVQEPTEEALRLTIEAPEPTTVIFKGQNLPDELLAADGSIGIRIPKMDFCHQLLRVFGGPIVSTSANFSGEPSPKSFEEISPNLIAKIDYCVANRNEFNKQTQGSRIVKLTDAGEIIVIR